jgi:hypothetical protein
MNSLSFTSHLFFVNTDKEITNYKTLVLAATSEATWCMYNCKDFVLIKAPDSISMIAIYYPTSS